VPVPLTALPPKKQGFALLPAENVNELATGRSDHGCVSGAFRPLFSDARPFLKDETASL
jgi:hypothetical protein